MDINVLIAIIKKKLSDQINIQNIEIEDKSFLHKNHKGNQEGKIQTATGGHFIIFVHSIEGPLYIVSLF